MDGFGAISWWGFSPALDLQCNIDPTGDDINILIVGAGDCRHIIKTLAHSYRHQRKMLNFYIVESNLELYARQMLLVCLALEPQQRLGLQDKTELFLEIHGNSLVRQQTMEYVRMMANNFIGMVTDFEFLANKAPIFDLSHLKFKERDFLEGIFKFWRNPDSKLFDIAKHWDLRLRQHLGVRYDAIPNVFDWDFHMKLVDRKAGIINSRKYLRWRQSGVAYEIRDANYNSSNKTLASGVLVRQMDDLVPRRGYFGDIVVGPYITFGIESEEESLLKQTNNAYTKTSEDVAEFNVISLLHEILHQEKYSPSCSLVKESSNSEVNVEKSVKETDKNDPKLRDTEVKISENPDADDASVAQTSEEMENLGIRDENEVRNQINQTFDMKTQQSDDKAADENLKKEIQETEELKSNTMETDVSTKRPLDGAYEQIPVEYAKIHLLSLNSVQELHKKSKFQQFFNLIYLSCSSSNLMTPTLMQLCSDSAHVVMETARFVLELKQDQLQQFNDKLTSLCEAAGCQLLGKCDDVLSESHLQFSYERSGQTTAQT